MLHGSIVALVTPWNNDRIDTAALRRMIEFQIENGTSAILPCGTTGESPAFSHDEQHQMIAATVEIVAGRVPVLAGAGSNSTREAVSLAVAAERLGADAVLSVTPYYNKPSQDGLVAHYGAIMDECKLPIVLYNVPGRTGCNLLPETAALIAQRGNVDSVKDATGDLNQTQDYLDAGLRVLSGDDAMTLPMMCMGGDGVISVVANFAPRLMADLCAAVAAADLPRARELQRSVVALAKVAFCETNPLPAKTACAELGLCLPEFRLPLTQMSEAGKTRLIAALKEHGVLAG
ncbi:MAG: 4-hydroxy-tetrahydrodipicolinate synthase [Planctomycetota bacterium]|jgi:4-hydroxy-tetrahydrodipicolinate synthase